MRRRTVAEKAALGVGALVFAVNVWRASVQSFTIDEAFTYNEFASKPLVTLLTLPYDANNQVLHSILCHWVVQFVGVSELTLRTPSLLGGLLFLIMSYRLCRLYFGAGSLFLVFFSLLALNPFTLDYLSVARGYGLAAGFFLVSLFVLSRHLLNAKVNASLQTRASFALALSVAANLTFIVPGVALVLVFVYLETCNRRRLNVWAAINQVILPGTAVAAVILLLPLIRASRDNFYFGSPTIAAAISSMTVPALLHHRYPLEELGRGIQNASPFLLAGLSLLLLASLTRASLGNQKFERRMPLLLTGGTLAVSCLLLVAGHFTTGMLYPHSRTGLYLVVLLTFATGSAASLWARRIGSAAAVLIIVVFAAQLTIGPYNMWVFDSGTKALVNLIRSDIVSKQTTSLRIASSNYLQPSLNFYRRRYHIKGLVSIENGPDQTADYFVLLPVDARIITRRGLTVIYRDPVSQEILARP